MTFVALSIAQLSWPAAGAAWEFGLGGWALTGLGPDLLLPLGAGLAAAIVILYVLRVRRRRISVPWANLWQRAVAPRRAARLWDRLKRLISLVLQLLLLALLLLALADPRPPGEDADTRAIVLLVDTSASMLARDESGGRLRIDRARDLARQALDELGPRDRVMLVSFDDRVVPLTPLLDDPAALEEPLQDLRASATPTDLAGAMQFAIDALQGQPRGRIVLISDGAGDVAAVESLPVPPNIDVRFASVGKSNAQNVAVTGFTVRRYPANRTNFEVFVQVASFAQVPTTVALSLYGDDTLVDTLELSLPAGEVVERIWTDLPAVGRQLRAEVAIVAGDAADVLAADDTAWALLPDAPPPTVLVVTPGNLYLEAPLVLNESIRTDVIAPSAWTPDVRTPSGLPYNVVVFDGIAPEVGATGNYLYLAPQGPDSPWSITGEVTNPIIHSTVSGHPLMRWVSALRDVNITRAPRLVAAPGDEVVASAIGGAPMFVARRAGGLQQVAMAFALTESDLALRVAWPVFLLNVLDWFTGDDARALQGHRTGETWLVPLPDREIARVAATAPDGTVSQVPARDGRAVFRGDQAGVWTIAGGDWSTRAAGNLSNPQESTIAARPTLALSGREAPEASTETHLTLPTDPWWLLVLVALGLMMLEWFSFQRRWTV